MQHTISESRTDPTEARPGHFAWSQSVLSILLLVGFGLPAAAQTLSGTDLQLHGGAILPAANPLLTSSSGTLRLEQATLGRLSAGNSPGSSEVQWPEDGPAVPDPNWIALPAPIALPADSALRAMPSHECSRMKGIASVPHTSWEDCGSRLPR